jgi:hypothetical protein
LKLAASRLLINSGAYFENLYYHVFEEAEREVAKIMSEV